jgi:hypothetical protein
VNTTSTQFMLGYFERVLGLRALPRRIVVKPRLLILDIPWPEGLARDEMFQKMMAAIGLSERDFEILECLPGELSHHVGAMKDRQEVLSFSQALANAAETLAQSEAGLKFRLSLAPGPRDLRHEPDKKRETWETLKTLKARLPS